VEFAYENHPVATRWEEEGREEPLAEDWLWVDKSEGVPELEAKTWRVAEAVERADGEFEFEEGWLLEDWVRMLYEVCPEDVRERLWDEEENP
jgi:hypothetical protein